MSEDLEFWTDDAFHQTIGIRKSQLEEDLTLQSTRDEGWIPGYEPWQSR